MLGRYREVRWRQRSKYIKEQLDSEMQEKEKGQTRIKSIRVSCVSNISKKRLMSR